MLLSRRQPITVESTIESRDTRPRRMQEVNSFCTDSRALQAEYCIVGTPHTYSRLVWKCINPWRRSSLPALKLTPSRLRFASTGCIVHSANTAVLTSVAQRSFAYNGPAVWNSLPATLRDSNVSLQCITFKQRLFAACTDAHQ